MKRIKYVGLATLVALALAVIPSTASAHGGISVNENWAPEFYSPWYPLNASGQQIEGEMEGKKYPKNLLNTVAGTLNCASVSFSGSFVETGRKLRMAPTYSACTLAGVSANVTPSVGCQFVFEITSFEGQPYTGNLGTCQMEITMSNCKIVVLSQSQPGTEYTNVGSGDTAQVDVKANVAGLEYEVSSKCPNKPTPGLYKNGTYKGFIRLSATP